MDSKIRSRSRVAHVATSLLCLTLLSACETPLPPTTPIAMRQASAVRAVPSSQAGCFSGQVGVEPWALAAAQSAVRLENERGFAGSGFIVHDSGDATDPHNRIVSGVHVVDGDETVLAETTVGAKPPKLVTIVTYDGQRIGEAEVVVRARPGQETIADGRVLRRGDQAVLRIKTFYRDGEQAYARIRGVDLAPIQPDRIIEGLMSDPGGVDGGASGSLVVDGLGQAIGVMLRTDPQSAGSASRLWQVRHRVNAGTFAWAPSDKGRVKVDKEIALPTISWAFAEPLVDGEVLGALGAAGFSVDPSRHQTSTIHIQSPGYALGYCVIYRGDMRTNSLVSMR